MCLSVIKKTNKFILFYFLTCFVSSVFAADFSYKNKDGLIVVSGKAGVIVNTRYIGWQKKWKWDTPEVKRIGLLDVQRYRLKFKKQGVVTHVNAINNSNMITYNFEQVFTKPVSETIGGGIEFKLNLDSQKRFFSAKAPELLESNSGWSWEFEKGKTIVVKFSPEIAKIYFERGNKSRIRAFFFADKIQAGSRNVTMKITLPIDSKIITSEKNNRSLLSRKGLVNSLSLKHSFVDLSYLNDKPAGKYGFVKSVGSDFEFENGTPIRFYGTNIQAYSLFVKDKKLIKQHAKRIAALGFNLVRLHHHDSIWLKNSLIAQGETSQVLNEAALDSYFWWIKCLRDEGIYIWVDLQVQRPWRRGDNIPGWLSDLARKAKKGMNVAKGFIYLNRRMQDLTRKFNEEFLTRVNPYTDLALKDDPAVMGLLITNENDLTSHFGNAFLKNKKHPYHQRLFDKHVSAFSSIHGLSERKLRETWLPGISKFLLNDLEAQFNLKMIAHLQGIGVKVPVATTHLWGRNASLYSLPALTIGDMVDGHSYAGGSPLKRNLLQKDPRYSAHFLHALGQGQVANKPFTVTEYNVDQKNNLDAAYMPSVFLATMASFQGWDATMLYGYSQDGLKGNRTSPWSSFNHPSIMGVIPAMALLYRQGHVAPAKQTVVLAPANDEIFTKTISPKTSVTIRTALEQHRLVVAMPEIKILPWLKPSVIDKDAIVIRDFNKNLLPANQDYIESDTGEIKRDWQKGIMTVNTPKSQLAMGRIGGRSIKLNDVTIKSQTANAAIIFTSLVNKPLNDSEKILLSAVARVAKVKVKKWKSSYISEPVNADLVFSSIYGGLRLIPLHADGSEGEPRLLTKMGSGRYSFSISEKDKTHWYIIRKVYK